MPKITTLNDIKDIKDKDKYDEIKRYIDCEILKVKIEQLQRVNEIIKILLDKK